MRTLKNVFVVFAFLLILCPALGAGDFTGKAGFSLQELNIIEAYGYDFVRYEGAITSPDVGAPALPVVQKDVAIPWDAEVQGIYVLHVDTVVIEGVFDVAPATRPVKVSDPRQDNDPYIKDPLIYRRDAFYPGSQAEFITTWDLAGQKMAKIAFHPVRYNPVTGKLLLATSIEFCLLWTPASQPSAQVTLNLTQSSKLYYDRFLKRKALNPDAVSIPAFSGSVGRALPPGQYEHVIITPQSFENEWVDLVQWRTRKGCPGMVVSKEYILANYSGGSDQEMIRNFVMDAHAAWGAMFFLIGADGGNGGSEMPYHEKTFPSVDPDSVPNDTYYADYDGDYVVDVHVGRASVTDSAEIGQFIDKVLSYEKTPALSNYCANALHLGFDLDSKTAGEETKEYIYSNHIPAHINFITEYDSESGGHLSDVIAYMNDGPNLLNHIDHCNWSVWGMGYVNHGELMYDSEVNSLTNGWKLINFYTLGCFASAWEHGESLSETFMRRVGNGGVSFTGNTRYGWYAQGHIDLYSSAYDIAWWKVLFDYNDYRVGETLSAHKNDFYPPNDYYEYIYTELNLLGDPAMPLWTDDPAALTVACDDPIFTGAQGYAVNVQSGGTGLEDALVCLWKGEEIYDHDTTDSSGDVDFTIDPVTTGAMLVTVTAQNHVPYEGSVAVSSSAPPEVTGISPEHGGVAGGTAVTITGDHFTTTPDTSVTFGGTPASGVSVINDTTINCTTPAHAAGDADVTVSNSNGSDTLFSGFTYHNAPQVSSIDPDNGSSAGGTFVTITGSNFTDVGTTTVSFDSTPASGVSVVNETTITCTTPANTAGDADVTVANDFGSDTLVDGFTYNTAPTVSGISPEHGPIAGGTAVTITGDHFTTTPDTSVTFGGTPASGISVINDTTINCTTPANTAGDADVTVSNSNGSDTLFSGFTYHNAPQVSSIDPDNGLLEAGTPVTIFGSDFSEDGLSVLFGGLPGTNVVVQDSSTITCETPLYPIPDLVGVEVANDYGTGTLAQCFEFLPPSGAPPMNLTDVDITNLYPGDMVRFSITGDPGAAYGLFLSLDPGPTKTQWGWMGLGNQFRLLWIMNLNAGGYQTFPYEVTDLGVGFINIYIHALVDDNPLIWATGGNNPNGTGSLMWGFN